MDIDGVTVPASVGILGRRSLLGGIVVLAGALFFIVGLPWLSQVFDENPFEAGQSYIVAESYAITPVPGWSLSGESDFFTTFEKSGATLVLTGAAPSEGIPPRDQLENSIIAFENDTTATWIIGEPTTFVTDYGTYGVSLTSHSETLATETWIISDGDLDVQIIAQVPDSIWPSITDELDIMVASVNLTAGGSGQ